MKIKKVFLVDWLLIPASFSSALTGIKLHAAGHFDTHVVWHNWAVSHVLTSLAFLVLGIIHVKMHWAWYKGWITKGIGNKSRVTALLSVIFFLIILTGVMLLALIDGANSPTGLWHYRVGLFLVVLSVWHIVKRWRVLRKSIA